MIKQYLKTIEQKIKAFPFLSGREIKIIALCLMIFDHFNKIIYPWYMANILIPMEKSGIINSMDLTDYDHFIRFNLYPIGAVAFPLFCFLLSEGFRYTSNLRKYILSILTFAFISELPFDIAFFSIYSYSEGTFPFYTKYQNVFFTLLIGLLCLTCIKKLNEIIIKKFIKNALQIICTIIFSFIVEVFHADYGAYGVWLIVGFYMLRKSRVWQIITLFFIYIIYTGNAPTISIYISAIIVLLYNGQRGTIRTKYLFYLIYPLHLIILSFMKFYLQMPF